MAFTSGSDKNVSMISSSFAQFMVFKVKPPSKVSYCYLHGDYSTSLCDILLFKIFTWQMTINFQIRYTQKMSCELIYSGKQFKPSTSLGFQLFLCAKSIIRNGGNTEEKLQKHPRKMQEHQRKHVETPVRKCLGNWGNITSRKSP